MFGLPYPNPTYTLSLCLTACNASQEFSGGAIFHISSLRVVNSTFVANEAGVNGVAIFSIGLLRQLSNIYFSGNMYHCRAGEYAYIVENEVSKTLEMSWNPSRFSYDKRH